MKGKSYLKPKIKIELPDPDSFTMDEGLNILARLIAKAILDNHLKTHSGQHDEKPTIIETDFDI